MEKVIITYKGKQYYKLGDNEKLKPSALFCKMCYFNDGKVDATHVFPIKHSASIGKKPTDFNERHFFNRVIPVIKKQKFKIENIFIEK
jgi:hypothetical protein